MINIKINKQNQPNKKLHPKSKKTHQDDEVGALSPFWLSCLFSSHPE